ncbi:MAG: molybdenum cofactor guanylyltransferase MobA [Pseudomonadota bacterium]
MANGITGLILAGGAGRRVGGADKGLLDYRGKPLVAHVIERFAPQVDALLISANRNLDAYLDYGYPVVTDASAERLGPLAGIAAGLRACDTPWLVVCPCDCPQLPPDLVARLMAGIGQARLAIASTSEGIQPTFMLCRRELLPALEKSLAAGERKVRAWCRTEGAVEVRFADAAAFRNLNTPDDLKLKSA